MNLRICCISFIFYLKTVQSVRVQCNQPIFEFTSDCHVGASNFRLAQSGKKINLKKPLNSYTTVKFTNEGSDAFKFKKCPVFSNHEIYTAISRFAANFEDNIPVGSAEIGFKNGSKLVLDLDENGKIFGTQKYSEFNSEELRHCQKDGLWKRNADLPWFTFYTEWNGLHLISYNLESFYFCQTIQAKRAYNCFEVEKYALEAFDGFYTFNQDSKFEIKAELFDLHMDEKDAKKVDVLSPLKACQSKNSILDWTKAIAETKFVSPHESVSE